MPVLLRLYVAGEAPNSLAARRTLRRILETLKGSDVELEIVDVFDEPDRAVSDGVLVTPTLLRIAPQPIYVIVGNLGDGERVRELLMAGEAP